MGLKIEFYPPQLHFGRDACAWIVCGFCVMVSSVYLVKFKIIETCMFIFGIILLMYFCNINGFIQIIFFVDINIFNRIILLDFFISVSIIILFDRHFNQLLFRVLFNAGHFPLIFSHSCGLLLSAETSPEIFSSL